MKKFTKYMSLSLVSLTGLGLLASCDNTKNDDYFSMAPAANAPVYFRVEAPQTIDLGESDTEYTYNIYRNSTSAPSTVSLSWSGATEYFFDLPTSVTFDDDAVMAEFSFGIDPTAMEPKTPYALKVTINEFESTTVTQNYIENNFQYLPMSEWAPFGYDEAEGRDGLGAYTFVDYYGGTEDPVLVEYRYSLLDEDEWQIRFGWLYDNSDPSLGWEYFLTAESHDGGKTIRVPEQEFAYNDQYGEIVYVSDMYYYTGDASYNDSYFDDVTGTFYLDLIYYISLGYFGNGYETCTLNGYLDTNDYSVTLTDTGMVTIEDTNYEIINISWTKYVALTEFTVVETASVSENGELSQTLLEDLLDKMDKGEVSASVAQDQGLYTFSFPNPGSYTVVAATYKQENDGSFTQKDYATVSFDYVTTDPNQGWHSFGYVEYTDGYVCTGYLTGITSYYVELQESDDYPEFYRLVDPYGADYPWNDPGDWNEKVVSYLYFDTSYPQVPYVDYSPQTLDWGEGTLMCYSQAANVLAGGGSPSDVVSEGLAGTWKGGVLTFPPMALMVSFDSGTNWYTANFALEQLEDGTIQPMTDDKGDYLAPFRIDFNTLTDDPMAEMATAGTRAAVAREFKKMGSSAHATESVKAQRNAKVVKYKSNNLNKGRRQAYKTTISNNPIK